MLSLVMEEIVQIMQARGATLTLHDSGPYPVITIYKAAAIGGEMYQASLRLGHNTGSNLPDEQIAWRSVPGTSILVAVIPVTRVPGHSRLLITIVFDSLDDAGRERVEQIYQERRPFAIGYFRFWQLNRLHMRSYRALEAALDCTEIGVMLLDRSSQVLFANQAADDMLKKGDGLSKQNGALRATNLRDGVNLSAALSHISVGSRGDSGSDFIRAPLLAFRRREGPSLVATIVPTRGGALEARDVAATVYLVDPRLNLAKNLGPICQLYGLSPVETKLVCYLAGGEPIADAAVKMRIKEQTARSYLKHIFIKTDTNRQTALVALMLSSLMRMKSDVVPEALTGIGAEQALAHCV